jgi:GAF domain-containing protein
MTNTDGLAQRLAELGRILIADESLDAVLKRVADLSTTLIEACDCCGVSLADGSSVSTRYASNERADRVDEIQYTTGEGPCLEAITYGRAVRVPSFVDEERWPAFIERAVAEGIRASYSVPLHVDDEIVGSLNFYSASHAFTEPDERLGDMLASQAAVALRNAQTFDEVLNVVEQLNEALMSRDTIGQAKGILMARFGLDADAAFDLLRVTSQERNIKLRSLAADLVAGRAEIEPGSKVD